MTEEFRPGSHWTRENARTAVARMAARLASPEMQALMREIGEAAADGADPAAVAATMAAADVMRAGATSPISSAACSYRRGRPSDIADFTRLIIAGDLPPMFIDDFVEGFVAVEHNGEVVGCGGLEVYDDSGVIRSVVVDERGRGQHIGERIAELLMEEARCAGLTDLYLFTMHARDFWLRLGFVDVALTDWHPSPRSSWQYQFIAQHPEAAGGVYSMWRAVKAQESV